MRSKITVRKVSRVKVADFKALYLDAGWWSDEYDSETAFINKAVKGSFCFVGAFDKGRMIGMGRALSDGCSDAYIQDVAVLKKYRGLGVGRRVVEEMIRILRKNGVDWIALVSEPDSIGFHHRNGFRKMPGHQPMKLEGV